MARVDLNEESAAAPQEMVPQILDQGDSKIQGTQKSVSEFQHLQNMFDAVTAKSSNNIQREDPSALWEEVPADLAKKFEDFFDTPTVYSTISAHGYTFKVRGLDSSHFLDPKSTLNAPVITDTDTDDPQKYMEFFRVLYMYFIHSLVHVEKKGVVLTAKELSGNQSSKDANYYNNIARNLAKKIPLDKMVDIVMEYSKFFNQISAPNLEKKN